jgi:hypothetical protein
MLGPLVARATAVLINSQGDAKVIRENEAFDDVLRKYKLP